jgi:PTH1 family peptidyl-tRNA hydrolase
MAWIVIGLGNPGEEYATSRHNTGRMGVEFFAQTEDASAWKEDKKSKSLTTGARIGTELLALVLPETYMNKSGFSAAKFVKSVKAAEKLIVVYDDLDLALGTIKISFDRGSGGHKGIDSIARALRTKRFVRIRIGISPSTAGGKTRKPQGEEEVEKFILGQFKSHEMDALKRVYKRVADAIETIITEGREIAMTRFN